MEKINEVIIVEGKHDISTLKRFYDAVYIKTDGTSISNECVKEIKNLKELGKNFIILTDPDYPGSYIRNKILEIIPEAKIGFVRKEKAKTAKKVGVEHADEEEIKRALSSLITIKKCQICGINIKNLIDLGLTGDNSSALRNRVSSYIGIGSPNAKQFLNRVNSLNYSYEKLKEIVKEVKDEK